MSVITRGVRNAFRNSIRGVSIIVILGLSVGLALSMLLARQAVEAKIESVKTTIGTAITVMAAGSRGFEGGGEPLKNEQVATMKAIAHVASVSATLNGRIDATNTSLQPAIEAGTLGKRLHQRSDSGGVISSAEPRGDFKLPIMATGTDDPTNLEAAGGGTFTLTSGESFASGSNENVALVGKELAAKNNLSVGSTFQAYGQTIRVVGIYDAGNKFASSNLMFPLATLQRLENVAGEISTATVKADSITNIDGVVAALKNSLGDKADVISQQDTAKQALEPLENIKAITLFSLVGAVAAGALILLLTMIMIVRERRREIGVLKAIGASNLRVMLQFMAESATLTLLGVVVGTVIALAAAGPLTQLLVSSGQSAGPRAMGRSVMISFAPGSGLSLQNINVSIGWDILLYGLVAALVIAVAGSAAASWLISKVRPAEVMRAE